MVLWFRRGRKGGFRRDKYDRDIFYYNGPPAGHAYLTLLHVRYINSLQIPSFFLSFQICIKIFIFSTHSSLCFFFVFLSLFLNQGEKFLFFCTSNGFCGQSLIVCWFFSIVVVSGLKFKFFPIFGTIFHTFVKL